MSGQTDIWSYLKESRKPLLLYGMGNGADKIIEALERAGISFADTFASDGFVRGQLFHGKKVLSYSEAKEKYGDFAVLLSFGSARPEVLETVERIEREREVLAPDVPVCGGALFTSDFYKENAESLAAARSLLGDGLSRRVFDEVIAYKLDGKLSHLRSVETDQREDMKSLFPKNFTAYADLGAYTGDTLEAVFSAYPSVQKAVAFEPSEKCYKKLCARLPEKGFSVFPCGTGEDMSGSDGKKPGIRVWNLAAWSEEKGLSFSDGAARNSSVSAVNDKEKSGAKLRTVSGGTLDAHCSFRGEKLLIKYDVEGAEEEALLGSGKTVSENEASLIVSCYHKSGDLFRLPLLIHKMLPHHALYLRKHIGFPAWDINLYCQKEK